MVAVDPNWPADQQQRAKRHNSEHEQWNKAIATELNDASRLFVLKPSFEGVCGLPKREDTKIQQAISKFNTIKYADVPESLRAAVNTLLALPH
jgi:hypothetical protein